MEKADNELKTDQKGNFDDDPGEIRTNCCSKHQLLWCDLNPIPVQSGLGVVDRAGFTPLAATFGGSGNWFVLHVMAGPRGPTAFFATYVWGPKSHSKSATRSINVVDQVSKHLAEVVLSLI